MNEDSSSLRYSLGFIQYQYPLDLNFSGCVTSSCGCIWNLWAALHCGQKGLSDVNNVFVQKEENPEVDQAASCVGGFRLVLRSLCLQ